MSIIVSGGVGGSGGLKVKNPPTGIPFSAVQLLLSGTGTPGASVFTDSSIYTRTPDVNTGITTETNAESFTGSSIQCVRTGPSYLSYSTSFAGLNEDYTFECFVQIIEQGGIGNGYAYARGIFIEASNAASAAAASSGTMVFGNAGMASTSTAITVLTPGSNTAPHSITGLANGFVRFHYAFTRQSNTVRNFVNGVLHPNPFVSVGNEINTLILGNRDLTSRDTSAYIDQVRFTKGYARYTESFTPPTAAFPTS